MLFMRNLAELCSGEVFVVYRFAICLSVFKRLFFIDSLFQALFHLFPFWTDGYDILMDPGKDVMNYAYMASNSLVLLQRLTK